MNMVKVLKKNTLPTKYVPYGNNSFNLTISPNDKFSFPQANTTNQFKSFSSTVNSNNQEMSKRNGENNEAKLKEMELKEEAYESGLKPQESNRNKYTMYMPYIQNKDMMLFHRNHYENGYEFDRLGKADFSKFTSKTPNYIYPKTTRFMNHKPMHKECLSYTNIHSQKNSLNNNNNDSYNHKMYNSNSEARIRNQYKVYKNKFHKKLLLCIGICNKDIRKDIGMRMLKKLEDEPEEEDKGKRYSLNNNITNFLDLNKKDHIPIIYPKSTSLMDTRMSLGEKNRHDKILDELLKVKYAILINQGKEKKIIIELLIKHGLYSDDDIKECHFNNFLQFLSEDPIKFSTTKTLKEILIEAMKYNNNNNNVIETKNEDREVEDNDRKSISSQPDRDKSVLNKPIKSKSQTIFEMYDKISLEKQKQYKDMIIDKDMKTVVKNLEDELTHLTDDKWNRNKSHIIKAPTSFYLTQCNPQYQEKEKEKEKEKENIFNGKDMQFILTNQVPIENYNKRVKEREYNRHQAKKILKKSLSEINERMYYSKLNKKQLDLKEIKLNKKFTELIMLERCKRKLVLSSLYSRHLSNDESTT